MREPPFSHLYRWLRFEELANTFFHFLSSHLSLTTSIIANANAYFTGIYDTNAQTIVTDSSTVNAISGNTTPTSNPAQVNLYGNMKLMGTSATINCVSTYTNSRNTVISITFYTGENNTGSTSITNNYSGANANITVPTGYLSYQIIFSLPGSDGVTFSFSITLTIT